MLYSRYISSAIRFRWLILILAGICVGLSFRPFYKGMDRVNFYREPERLVLSIQAGMLEGSTVGQLNEVVKGMENYLASYDGIDLFTTSIDNYDNAVIQVFFSPEAENTIFPQSLKSDVTSMAINFGGANWRVSGIDDNYFNNNIVSSYKTDAIILSGYNYDELLRYAEALRRHLSAHKRVSGPEIWSTGYFSRPSTEFNMEYDFEKLAILGIDPADYYQDLTSRLYASGIGRYATSAGYAEVVLESSEAASFDLWHVQNVSIGTDSLKTKLAAVGGVSKQKSGLTISKKDHVYQVQVAFDFIGSHILKKELVEKELEWMNDEILPVGYKAEDRLSTWFDQNKDKYLWLILVIIAAIYLVTAITLESFTLPLAVVMMIPLSFIGTFLVFGLSKLTFDQGGFASFIMLSGLTVNAALYILMERKGRDIRSYVKAFGHKAVPIFLTVLSTILGLLPFLSDGPKEVFWFDFALGTISGMGFSLIAIILVLPVFVNKKPRR